MPPPQWDIRGEAQSRLECGLRVLHVSPPWVERHMHDQMGVVGSQWVWVRSCRHSHPEHVQHWVVYSWEAIHMVGRNACSEPTQNEGRSHFPTHCLPDLPYARLDDLLD